MGSAYPHVQLQGELLLFKRGKRQLNNPRVAV
jgi:hypothetical protein